MTTCSSFDTGYVIVKPNATHTFNTRFWNISRNYVKQTTSSVQRDLAEGQISIALIHEADTLSIIAAQNCHANKELRRIQRWMLSFFPDTAAPYLFPKNGYLTQPVGEGLLVHACTAVLDYKIFWNKKYNNTCYHNFPVAITSSNKLYFLEPSTKRLVSRGHIIPCNDRPPASYISDRRHFLWKINLDGYFSRVKPIRAYHSALHLHLPKIGHFNTKLLHYSRIPPSRVSLLQLLSRSQE